MKVQVGQRVRFDPFMDVSGFASTDNRGRKQTGTVVMVNVPHKWFSVEYSCWGTKQRTSFKFSQFGRDVLLCGRTPDVFK